jgi:hypothetical protein
VISLHPTGKKMKTIEVKSMSKVKATDLIQQPTSQPEKRSKNASESDGLTDDQRVSREKSDQQSGARVTPGPADNDRLTKR